MLVVPVPLESMDQFVDLNRLKKPEHVQGILLLKPIGLLVRLSQSFTDLDHLRREQRSGARDTQVAASVVAWTERGDGDDFVVDQRRLESAGDPCGGLLVRCDPGCACG